MPAETSSTIAAILSDGQANDVAISRDGAHIYAAGNDGNLRVYNALTGALENTWHVGTQLGGISISPDGTFMMATELTPLGGSYSNNWTTDTTQTTTYKIDLSTGAVTSFPVTVTQDEYVFNDVAILANGTVLLSEQELPGWSGWVPAWILDPSTGTYTKIQGGRMSDFVSVTNDGTHALFGENDISDASLSMYQSGSTTVLTHGNYQNNVMGFNSGVQAISGEAHLTAQGMGNDVNLYDLNLNYQFNLASKLPQISNDTIAGLAFDASGQNLYLLDSAHNTIIDVSTTTWTVVHTVSISGQLPATDSRFADSLLISPDSHYFTVLAGGKVYEIGNPSVPYVLNGTAGDDHLTGTMFNDVITGGLGADTLTGAGGNDTFKDTAAGHNGDTITDFHAGDQLIFTDATLGSFSYSQSGNTLTYTGGSMTLGTGTTPHLVAEAAPTGGVQLTVVQHAVTNDFNGDGKSDILWMNDGGTMTDWLGTSAGSFTDNSTYAYGPGPGTGWVVAGTGDFNGDGRVDVLFRNSTTGAVTDWLANGNGSFTDNSTHAFNAAADNSWQIVGTGDFNGDGISDILWRNTSSGYLTEWLGTASGGFTDNASHAATGAADNNWQISGIGDFNGDGISDILWRNSGSGYLTEWLGTSNGAFADNANIAATGAADTSWHVVSIGDFNGDGFSDILWRNGGGITTEWLGTSTGSFNDNTAHAKVTVGTDWHVQDPLL